MLTKVFYVIGTAILTAIVILVVNWLFTLSTSPLPHKIVGLIDFLIIICGLALIARIFTNTNTPAI